MPMTWPQVYRNCESQRVERANTTVKIKTLRLGVSGRPKLPTAAAKVYSLDKVRGGHRKHVYVVVAKWLNHRGHVHLSCSCPDFMYTYEYALTRKGASSIKYCDGTPPVERNIRGIPGACKHLIHLMDHMTDTGLARKALFFFNPPKTKTRR